MDSCREPEAKVKVWILLSATSYANIHCTLPVDSIINLKSSRLTSEEPEPSASLRMLQQKRSKEWHANHVGQQYRKFGQIAKPRLLLASNFLPLE